MQYLVLAVSMCLQKAQCVKDKITEVQSCYDLVLEIVQGVVNSIYE